MAAHAPAIRTPSRTRRWFDRLRGVPVSYDMDRYDPALARIAALEPDLAEATADAITARAVALRAEIGRELRPDQLALAFALVRESAKRTIGLRAYDVQVRAALGLHEDRLIEMQTGEGKTLVIVFAAFAAALAGRGVHVITFNDYLAQRDAAWMGPAYALLGLRVGVIHDGQDPASRREAYAADITYAAAKQIGFDFLRDGVALSAAEQVQRPLYTAIVDEADALLVDEARVPMVIAAVEEAPPRDIHLLADLIKELEPGRDYDVDREARSASFTDAGLKRCEAWLGCGELVSPGNVELYAALNSALHVEVLLRLDVDYILRDRRVELVDEITGRVIEDRHWPYGLQAALEAKEGLELHPEGQLLGSITVHHLLERYERLAGLTATARPAAEECRDTYGLSTLVVPTHEPCVRVDLPDRIFRTKAERDRALVAEIRDAHAAGRPILVGTVSVAASEALAAALADEGIDVQVLNARNAAEEARIIARAGLPGAVTVSTNMAGRGTDIRLGGPDEARRDEAVAAGGLYVIGTNRHDSLRIDQQLRGRAGRQGDPGSSRFFLSLEDDMVVRYNIANIIPRRVLESVTPEGHLTSPVVEQRIAHAQRIVEGQHHRLRQRLRIYGDLVEGQRQQVRERRDQLLRGDPTVAPAISPALAARANAEGLGEAEIAALMTRLALLAIDRRFRDHIAYAADQRDTIFLERLGGRDPALEFRRRVGAAFADFWVSVDQTVAEQARALAEAPDFGPSAESLQGPSSTWTFLMDDTAFGDGLGAGTLGNVGLGVGLGLGYWPLLVGAWLRRLFKRRPAPD